VKHQLRRTYYLRYCDDFVILSNSRQELVELIPQISQFLGGQLGLSLHPHKVTVRAWQQGIDFLGYVLKPHCTLLRSKTRLRTLRRAEEANLARIWACAHTVTGTSWNSYSRQRCGQDLLVIWLELVDASLELDRQLNRCMHGSTAVDFFSYEVCDSLRSRAA